MSTAAAKQIKAAFNNDLSATSATLNLGQRTFYMQKENEDWTAEGCKGQLFCNEGGFLNDGERAALNKALISGRLVKKEKMWAGFQHDVILELTPEGKKYLIKEDKEEITDIPITHVKTREVDTVEIMGIAAPSDIDGLKVAMVEFKATCKDTPFGEVLKTEPLEGKCGFVLYDDGWRLKTD